MSKTETKTKSKSLKVPAKASYGTGKRKTAIAKVWLFKGNGTIEINRLNAANYLKNDLLINVVKQPLKELGLEEKYDCFIKVNGGGLSGQADAARMGVARALLQLNEEFRKKLKEEGFLTRDSRIKERKKYGCKKARKGFQFRKR